MGNFFKADENEAVVLAKVNELRASGRLRPVAKNERLAKVAQTQASKMALHNRLSHTAFGDVGDRAADEGYKWTFVCENIAYGQTAAEAVVRSWRNSPDHFTNMMDGRATEAGVGFSLDKEGRIYWCIVLGSSK